MDIKTLQDYTRQSVAEMKTPFRSATEIMLALTEELGEVATEVALIEQVGSKAEWNRPPNAERLTEEILHMLNLLLALANHYNRLYSNLIAAWFCRIIQSRIGRIKEFLFYHSANSALSGFT
jgi:NTP pyrophosphatase (non-canonical NTP hydrolase)